MTTAVLDSWSRLSRVFIVNLI